MRSAFPQAAGEEVFAGVPGLGSPFATAASRKPGAGGTAAADTADTQHSRIHITSQASRRALHSLLAQTVRTDTTLLSRGVGSVGPATMSACGANTSHPLLPASRRLTAGIRW